MVDLRATTPPTQATTAPGAATAVAGSKSMPTAVKKMPSRSPRSGITSAKSAWDQGVADRTRPPTKAPTASVSPMLSAITADPITARKATMVKTSRERTWVMRSSSGGSRKRATIDRATRASTARSTATATEAEPPASTPAARIGTASRNGTMHRSWKSRMPTASCPWGASSSPRSASSRITTAVLDIATRAPTTRALGRSSPKALATAVAIARVAATWSPPATRA
jgi:hypothetical protein